MNARGERAAAEAQAARPVAPQEFHYRVRQHAAAHVPGAHRSRRGDSGLEFRAHVALVDAADVRRIDLHASLRDPLRQWQVRVFSERKAVAVIVLADLSASMGYRGERRKLDVLADFTAAAALSAWRTGDPFGFVGFDASVRSDWIVAPTRRCGIGPALAQRLRAHQPQGGASGLLAAARVLPRRRALVFLVSDFHLPLAELDRLLASLAHHEVVPVQIWDRHEFDPPHDGLFELADPETGAQRLVWMRSALRERWKRARDERLTTLHALFQRHRLRALLLADGYRAELVSGYFLGA